jgi:hypothetical protein
MTSPLQPLCELNLVVPEFPVRKYDEIMYLDSGASHSFTLHHHLLHNYSVVGDVTCSFAGVGSGAGVKGIGSLLVKGDPDQHIQIDNVFHGDQL